MSEIEKQIEDLFDISNEIKEVATTASQENMEKLFNKWIDTCNKIIDTGALESVLNKNGALTKVMSSGTDAFMETINTPEITRQYVGHLMVIKKHLK